MRAYERRRSITRDFNARARRCVMPNLVRYGPEIILNQIAGWSFLARDAIRSETKHHRVRVRFTVLIRQYCVYT